MISFIVPRLGPQFRYTVLGPCPICKCVHMGQFTLYHGLKNIPWCDKVKRELFLHLLRVPQVTKFTYFQVFVLKIKGVFSRFI